MPETYIKPCIKCGSTDRGKPSAGKRTGNCVPCNRAINARWVEAGKLTRPAKPCRRCGVSSRVQGHNGRWYCAPCKTRTSAEYGRRPEVRARVRQRHHDSPERHWRHTLKTLYGLTPEDYASILCAQGGKCGICGRPPRDDRKLCVDHDHATGDVRGLLCDNCNHGAGMYRDDPSLLRRAADWVEGGGTWRKLRSA